MMSTLLLIAALQTVVSGTAQPVAADASDNVGVNGIFYELDGQPIGEELFSPPVQNVSSAISWDTTTLPNGIYTITVFARDEAGNEGSASVVVDVQNADTEPPTVVIIQP